MAETNTQPAVKRTAASKKSSSIEKSTRAKTSATAINDQKRYEMVQYAAYFIAESSNFDGDPHSFWVAAEAQISNLLSKKKP